MFFIVETLYYKQKFIVRADGVMEAKRKTAHALAKNENKHNSDRA